MIDEKNSEITYYNIKMHTFERQDAIRESRRSVYRHPRTKLCSNFNLYARSNTNDTDFSHLSRIKLNKNKKYMLEEQRNTQIDRSNRLLYEKIAKQANRIVPVQNKRPKMKKHRHKLNTMPHSPKQRQISPHQYHRIKANAISRNDINKHSRSIQHRNSQEVKTLFMGHQYIDGVQFKIKLMITNGTYYLIAENEHSRIFLQMPQQQYWELHYKQLSQNPCHIFQYLQIEKGRIQFRIKKQQSLPKGVNLKDRSKSKNLKSKKKRKYKTQQKLKTKQNTQIQEIRKQILIRKSMKENQQQNSEHINQVRISKRKTCYNNPNSSLTLPKI